MSTDTDRLCAGHDRGGTIPRNQVKAEPDGDNEPESPGRSETLQYLYDRHIGDDPGRIAAYEREVAEARAAMAPDTPDGYPPHVPNAETREALRDAHEGPGWVSYGSPEEMFKALDIEGDGGESDGGEGDDRR